VRVFMRDPSTLGTVDSDRFVLFVTFAVFLVLWFFIQMLGKGRNWARIVFLIFFIINIPFDVLALFQVAATNSISGLLGIGRTAILIIAIFLLFQKPSSVWFNELKARKPAQQGIPADG